MARHLLACGSAIALLAAACATQPQPAGPADGSTASGRGLVEVHCAACHAVGRADHSRHRDAPAFRALSRSYPVTALEESLAEGIMVGHPDMPEYKFSSGDVAAIISYLQSIQE